MGDRGNILVRQRSNQDEGKPEYIFIYAHWDGSELPHILQRALIHGKSRWDDEPYLTRIIISEVIGKSNWDSLTGVGVSTYLCDNEHALLIVDCDKKTVSSAARCDEDREVKALNIIKTVSFEQYANLSTEEIDAFRGEEKE